MAVLGPSASAIPVLLRDCSDACARGELLRRPMLEAIAAGSYGVRLADPIPVLA